MTTHPHAHPDAHPDAGRRTACGPQRGRPGGGSSHQGVQPVRCGDPRGRVRGGGGTVPVPQGLADVRAREEAQEERAGRSARRRSRPQPGS